MTAAATSTGTFIGQHSVSYRLMTNPVAAMQELPICQGEATVPLFLYLTVIDNNDDTASDTVSVTVLLRAGWMMQGTTLVPIWNSKI